MSRNRGNLGRVVIIASLALAVLTPQAFGAGPVMESLERPAIEVRDPQDAFMVGVTRVGSTLVAVGERGLVLLSDDEGASWRQAQVPVSTSLTAVRFADEQHGMAVGHGGVVLGTSDGGESWRLLLDGRKAAELALDAAERGGDKRAILEARRLVSDGPDKPFLDLLLTTPDRALVVGAYGLAFETRDGGNTWISTMDRMDNPGLLHFYAIRQRGDRIVVAGERGLINLSDDGGRTFDTIGTPYNGSFFTVELPARNEILVAGLKGNVWLSDSSGRRWSSLGTELDASITSSVVSRGGAVLGTQAGSLLRLAGGSLMPVGDDRLPPINAFVTRENGFVVMTAEGIRTTGSGREEAE